MARKSTVVTLATIARRCRVSTATVSKALSDEPSRCDLPPATTARIRAASERLGYAAGWRRARLKATIALVLPGQHFYLTGTYFDIFPQLLHACDTVNAILVTVAVAKARSLDSELTRHQARGAIIVQADRAWMDEALPTRYPLVLYNNDVGPDCLHVMPDERANVQLALTFLADQGHQQFCYLDAIDKNQHCSVQQRRDAMHDAHGKNGKNIHVTNQRDGLMAAIRAGSTAVMTYDGKSALTALGWLTESGIRVPHDVSLLAMSNSELLAHAWPSITMVWHSVDQMALAAVHAAMAPPEGAKGGIFPGKIVAGGSTSPPRRK